MQWFEKCARIPLPVPSPHPLEKEKEKKKGLILFLFLNVNGVSNLVQYTKKKDRAICSKGAVLMLRAAVRSAMMGRIVRAGPIGCPYFGRIPRPELRVGGEEAAGPFTRPSSFFPPLSHQKFRRHELPFCGVVAGPLGDWLRV